MKLLLISFLVNFSVIAQVPEERLTKEQVYIELQKEYESISTSEEINSESFMEIKSEKIEKISATYPNYYESFVLQLIADIVHFDTLLHGDGVLENRKVTSVDIAKANNQLNLLSIFYYKNLRTVKIIINHTHPIERINDNLNESFNRTASEIFSKKFTITLTQKDFEVLPVIENYSEFFGEIYDNNKNSINYERIIWNILNSYSPSIRHEVYKYQKIFHDEFGQRTMTKKAFKFILDELSSIPRQKRISDKQLALHWGNDFDTNLYSPWDPLASLIATAAAAQKEDAFDDIEEYLSAVKAKGKSMSRIGFSYYFNQSQGKKRLFGSIKEALGCRFLLN